MVLVKNKVLCPTKLPLPYGYHLPKPSLDQTRTRLRFRSSVRLTTSLRPTPIPDPFLFLILDWDPEPCPRCSFVALALARKWFGHVARRNLFWPWEPVPTVQAPGGPADTRDGIQLPFRERRWGGVGGGGLGQVWKSERRMFPLYPFLLYLSVCFKKASHRLQMWVSCVRSHVKRGV